MPVDEKLIRLIVKLEDEGTLRGLVYDLVMAARALRAKCDEWGTDYEDVGAEVHDVFEAIKPFGEP